MIAYICVGIGVVELRSRVAASSLQLVVQAGFYTSVIGAILCTGRRRVFWVTFGIAVWGYLFLETHAAWPYSYYLGPAPYLYAYHPSVSSSWVSAQSLAALFVAFHLASLVTMLAYRKRNALPDELAIMPSTN